jgi:hypothetical protein
MAETGTNINGNSIYCIKQGKLELKENGGFLSQFRKKTKLTTRYERDHQNYFIPLGLVEMSFKNRTSAFPVSHRRNLTQGVLLIRCFFLKANASSL